MEVVGCTVAGATVEKALTLIVRLSMLSVGLIKKCCITGQLALPSISMSNSDRQRYCFLMRRLCEKAPQGIDKRFGYFVATKHLASAGKKMLLH